MIKNCNIIILRRKMTQFVAKYLDISVDFMSLGHSFLCGLSKNDPLEYRHVSHRDSNNWYNVYIFSLGGPKVDKS